MPAVTLTPADLAPFADITEAKAEAMIVDALAEAERVAPCIVEDDFEYAPQAKAIIRGAIIRWNDAGSGALQQMSQGTFSKTLDTRQARRRIFWPSEINDLAGLCADSTSGEAHEIDTLPEGAGVDYGYTTLAESFGWNV